MTSNAIGLEKPDPGARAPMPVLPAVAILLLTVVLVIPAIIPDLLAPGDPVATDLANTLSPPSATNWLGTDTLGRDIYTRLVHGAFITASIALTTILGSSVIGTVLGILAGYYGGWIDATLMRLADIVFSLPAIMLAITGAALFGPSIWLLVAIVMTVMWAEFARLVRGEVLKLRNRDFIVYARTVGVGDLRIAITHILPNVANSLVVLGTLQVGHVILIEASLSFIGAGVPPPHPAWGSMVANGSQSLTNAWWISIFPGAAIVLVVLSINLLGDWLRDRLDPRLSGVTYS